MTAKEKFEARLKELGLWERWCENQECGRIGAATEEGTIVLVHEYEDDEYTEFTFPHLRELQESKEFREKALAEYVEAGDEKFIRELVWWYLYPNKNKCPLYPEDLYSICNEYTWKNFDNDGIMNCTNNHDAELVKRINTAYAAHQISFLRIVECLIERDYIEYMEKVGERPMLGCLSTISTYCQLIADNKDLETILSYCRE